jgi:hypothetical protein
VEVADLEQLGLARPAICAPPSSDTSGSFCCGNY